VGPRRNIRSPHHLLRLSWLFAVCFIALSLHPCHAQFTPRDGQIIARTLGFLESASPGVVEIGIVYSPNRSASVRQAQNLQAAIGDALVAGKITLKARLIPVDQLPGVSGIGGIFITRDLGPHLDEITAAARRLHVPTISTEMGCARTAHCIVAFSSEPTVEITLNHEAASDAGVHFTQAFRMLVREF
jgi:hypothetical protein